MEQEIAGDIGMNDIKSRLLLLVGEPDLRYSLSKVLESEGFEVALGSGVHQGLEYLNSSFFDVVITDLQFPDGSGIEVLKFCSEYCLRTKVICMVSATEADDTDAVSDALGHGAAQIITTPFNFAVLVHAVRCVLEKMSMEEAVGLEKERYAALINDLKEGYFVLEDRKFVYANKAMVSMLRYSAGELDGREFTQLLAPEMIKEVETGFAAFEQGHSCQWQKELVFCDAGGNEVPVEVRLSMSGKGRFVLAGMCREITERDLMWNRLVRAEKFALMGEMTAGIAHELNNKLTPILGFVELLRMSLKDHESRGRIDAIHGAALGARKIVQSLLSFARKEKSVPIPVNVNDLIETSVSLIMSSFGSSSVDVLLDMEPGGLSVKADAVQIEQVLTNMFKNAFEAMGAKGRLTVRSRRNGSEVLIIVRDTGPGIPAELQSRIFNPFFTTKIRGSGTGLGLSICNGIIRKHGGRLELDSSSEGTEFRIILPAASENINSGRSGTQGSPENILQRMVESGMQRTPSMLVVDDEPEIGRLVTELFCYKFDIEVVGNGREALDRMRERQFDIIISDIKMPLVDGIEFHRIVSAVFPQYINRIIYTTGVAFDRDVSAFLKRTGVPYLSKPFKVAQLMKIVTGMLEKGDDCRAVA